MSRAALGLDEAIVAARSRQALSRIRPGEVGDLLDEVRRTVTRAMVWVTFGDTELEPVVLAAVADFDRAIKMMGTPELRRRRELADRLRAATIASSRPSAARDMAALRSKASPSATSW